MSRFHICSLVAIVACLSLPAAVQAAPDPGGAVPQAVQATPAAQPVAQQAMQPAAPVIYLVQPQAAAAPATTATVAAPAAAQSSGVGAVLKAVPIETWGLILGVIALVVLQLLGAKGATVRSKIDTWIDLAYYAAEAAARAAGPDSPVNKISVALDAFHRGLLGEGLKATATDVAKAQAAWTAKAEAEHVETEIRARAAAQAAAETKPVGAGALLAEAAKV